MATTTTPTLIGAPEAARRLGVDRSTLTRWVQAGRVDPYVKMPGKNGALVFDLAVIDALIVDAVESL